MSALRLSVLVLMVAIARSGAAQQATIEAGPRPVAPEKARRYSLFRPTPWDKARELSTDRPDMTESPYTVPAGRFQFEFDLVTYSRDVSGPAASRIRNETVGLVPANLKIGLLPNVDFQLQLETYLQERSVDLATNTRVRTSRFGEVAGRVKINLWGNDGGKTAFAIMPFLAFTPGEGSRRITNSGVIIPLAVDLGGGFGLGTMAEFDFVKAELAGPRHTVMINSVTVSHDLATSLGGYAEFFSAVSTEAGSGWVRTANVGLTRGIGANVQFDGGINIGISGPADGVNPFLGLSFRF